MDTQPNDNNQNKDNYSEYKNLLDQYASNTDTQEPTRAPPAPPFPPTPNYPQKTPDSTNIFKYIFFASLIIFLAIYSFIAFTLIKKPSTTSTTTNATLPTSPATPSPTSIPTQVCALNDKNYEVGESFTAADGCNTCTCSEDLSISCTEKVCPTAKPTIKTSTQSAEKSGNL
ncbi:MAG: hypothetical protein Q8P53_04630 [Candidatus Shapirobacteria bacterium]|nr:hypothetical protein [Candidatus Shapirobacteria bacterium]